MRKGPPVIGLSSCMFQPDPERPIFKGKRLLYMEESMFHWIARGGALPLMVPTVAEDGLPLPDVIRSLDGLVLTGGVDVSPTNYGEEPLVPEWAGDPIRDAYEIALLRAAVAADVPVLGVCRGAQVINVGFGGTLFQDIQQQNPGARLHRDWDVYENHFHDVRIEPGSGLARLYPGVRTARINSVHHQAVKDLGRGLVVEAVCVEDGIIEAIRLKDKDAWVFGVQWHPEFQDPSDASLLPARPILEDFLAAVNARRGR